MVTGMFVPLSNPPQWWVLQVSGQDMVGVLALLILAVVALVWLFQYATREGIAFPTLGGYPAAELKDPEMRRLADQMFRRWCWRGVVAGTIAGLLVAPFVWLL